MDEATVLERLRGPWARRELDDGGQSILLGAELVESGELDGDVVLRWQPALHRNGEVGYVFHSGRSGRGCATEALHHSLHLAFEDLGLGRVVARVDAENEASARLWRRLGLRLEARLVENAWFRERWLAELDFAFLDREWEAPHESGRPAFGVSG